MSRLVHVIDHPSIQHKLTLLRQKKTSTNGLRQLINVASMLQVVHSARVRHIGLFREPKTLKAVDCLKQTLPDVSTYTSVIGEGLNDHSCIVLGMGDAGDRILGTQ